MALAREHGKMRTGTTREKVRPAAVAGQFYPLQPERLRAEVTRLIAEAAAPADTAPGDPWAYGASVDALRGLVEYWRGAFDWRAQVASR